MTQWIQVLLIGLAGFLLFPVPIAIATFYVLPTGERRKWLAVAAWSVSAAAYTVSVVLFYWNGPPYSELLLNLRVGTFYLSILSFIWVVTELSGRFFRKLAIALCALVAIRAVLWFTTELIWIQGFTPTGEQISGPLEVWSRAGISLIVAAILVASVRQPWPSELARKASTWVVFPVAVVLSFIYEVQSPDFDALQALLAAVPLLVIEVAVLSDLARAARAASSSRRRVLLLEEMTTESLAPGHAVTVQRAFDAIVEELNPARCEYRTTAELGGADLVLSTGFGAPSSTARRFSADVQSAGRTVGELSVVGTFSRDELTFFRHVAFVLSTGLGRESLETSLQKKALSDPLTGLPGWVALQDHLGRLIRTNGGHEVLVSLCNIRELRKINAKHGYEVGNELLRKFGRRLSHVGPATSVVGRSGYGDIVYAQIVTGPEDEARVVRTLDEITKPPFHIGDLEIHIDLQQGTALSVGTSTPPDLLVRNAATALVEAKLKDVAVLSFTESTGAASRLEIVEDLSAAIEHGEIFVEYQPIVELSTRKLVGVEALARWEPTPGKRISPDEFIAVAQSAGLMTPLTRVIFTQAVTQLAVWGQQHPELRRLRLSLNITSDVISAPDFLPWLTDLMTAHGIAFHRLTLELTESAIALATRSMIEKIREFCRRGAALSLDDFGTGHSTLNRLRVLPVHEIKVDRAFTKAEAGSHRAVVGSVVELANIYGLTTVAEGVETEQQHELLLADGCNYGQGYLYSRPITGDLIPGFAATTGIR